MYEVYLNKYYVIFLDIQWMYGNALEEIKKDSSVKIVTIDWLQTEFRKIFDSISHLISLLNMEITKKKKIFKHSRIKMNASATEKKSKCFL